MRDAGLATRDAGHSTEHAARGTRDAGHGTRDAGRGTRDAEAGGRTRISPLYLDRDYATLPFKISIEACNYRGPLTKDGSLIGWRFSTSMLMWKSV